MFRDQVRLKLQAGKGGNGRTAFGPFHRPLGGTGGDGGDLYVQGDNNLYDFGNFQSDTKYAAENGENGGSNNLTGRKGKDLIIRVPLVTKIYDLEGKLIQEISKHGEQVLLLKGGVGGFGNWHFRHGGISTAEVSLPGRPGEELNTQFVLELQSDIIFIGLPNAGKSSILNELTNAEARVAAYAFTTLSPQLGRMDDIVLMDLPGLIENSAQNKALGTSFVKHTHAAKLVAHFVSLESADPVADYELIRKELKAIDAAMYAKPEIVVLTKSDTIPSEELKDKEKLFKKAAKSAKAIVTVSAFDLDALEKLKQVFTDNFAAVK